MSGQIDLCPLNFDVVLTLCRHMSKKLFRTMAITLLFSAMINWLHNVKNEEHFEKCL